MNKLEKSTRLLPFHDMLTFLYNISKKIYQIFGYQTYLYKVRKEDEAKEIQKRLDSQHRLRDKINETYGLVYTTKQAFEYVNVLASIADNC